MGILDIIFPKRCPICDEVMQSSLRICTVCKDFVLQLSDCTCYKCGRRLNDVNKLICENCQRMDFHYERAFSLWSYEGYIRNSIRKFKYNGRCEYAEYYSEEMYAYISKLNLEISAVVPVPIHRARLSERGYNQAELISKRLAKKLNIPHYGDYLIRIKNTVAQNSLNMNDRKKNLISAFSINLKKYPNLKLNTVLLIDDIYTTGSTAELCTLELKRVGVKRVFVLCLSSVPEGEME